MKKALFLFLFFITSFIARTQEQSLKPNVTLKWAPTGLVWGNISLQGEYSFNRKNSLTAKIGLPVAMHRTLDYEDKDAVFKMKAVSFLAGYRHYLSKRRLHGFYIEPFVKYVNHSSEGTGEGTLDNKPVVMSFSNDYNGAGIGLQLGSQFRIGKRFVIDLFFLGPEINSASNQFKSVETSKTLPWSSIEASDAEWEIRQFIEQFPVIRNRTTIMVDKANRSVRADFKGALPGIRAGVSFGVAF